MEKIKDKKNLKKKVFKPEYLNLGNLLYSF